MKKIQAIRIIFWALVLLEFGIIIVPLFLNYQYNAHFDLADIGGLLIAPSVAIPLVWQILEENNKESETRRRLASGLSHEIMKNIQTVFQGEMEDVIERDMYRKVKLNLQLVKIEEFNYVSNLYRFSRSYQNMIKAWRKNDPNFAAEKFTKLKLQYTKFLHLQLGFSEFKAEYKDTFEDLVNLKATLKPEDPKQTQIAHKIEDITKRINSLYKKNKEEINKKLDVFVKGMFAG